MRLVFCVLALAGFALLPGCGGGSNTYNPTLVRQGTPIIKIPAGTFSLDVTPATTIVTPGEAAAYTVTLRASNGFNNAVQLVVSGIPDDTTAVFSPASVTPTAEGTTSTLTVTTTAAGTPPPTTTEPGSLAGTIRSIHRVTSPGVRTLTIVATGGGVVRTATVQLAVVAEQQLTLAPPMRVPGTRIALYRPLVSAWLLARKKA